MSTPSRKSAEIRKTLVRDKLDGVPIAQKRKDWDDYAKSVSIPDDVSVTGKSIEGIFCLWLSTRASLDNYVLVYIHGGGLTEGSVYTAREWTARLARQTNIPVLSVDYSLAPEHPYPAALADMKRVYQHLHKRYRASNIFFGADSSGCNLALATLVVLRDEGEALPAASFFISPSVDLTLSGESFQTRLEVDPIVTKEVLAFCAEQYAQGIDLVSPTVSPLFGNLSGLPPILIHAGDHEILLSDAVRLCEGILKAKGQATI